MFTGIVSDLGSIRSRQPTDAGALIDIEAPATVHGLTVGDSVAVNGVCLTAVAVTDSTFSVDVIHETLARTALGSLDAGDPVDLERPMPGDGRFDGHIVQGHVDGVGRIATITEEGASRRLRIGIPDELARYTVEKGSIAVDGTSLTVMGVGPEAVGHVTFEIGLIPHTLAVTVLGVRRVGDQVNLETDVVAKYVERLVAGGAATPYHPDQGEPRS